MAKKVDSREDPLAAAREAMVAGQIEARGIKDTEVLKVMRRIPRHLFVPDEFRDEAYSDGPLSIGHRQTISQLYIVAYMTEKLSIRPSDRVLEIGTGSGYQTAILAALAARVYTVEVVGSLASEARRRLESMKYSNILFRTGNGWKGWPEEAPFDKIMVTAAPSRIPEDLIDQLKEGGKIVIPAGIEPQELIEGEKRHGILQENSKILVRFVPLVNPQEKGEEHEN